MKDVLIVVGALLAFCLLTFGAAWLTAVWMGRTPVRWRSRGRGRR